MNYNAVISVEDISDSSGTITEPVTLQEMKDYLRLDGFSDSGDSPGTTLSDFDFDDTLVSELITMARQLIEEKSGISIVSHTWEAVITNLCGRIEIPYGPNVEVTSLVDSYGTVIPSTSYKIVGNTWKNLVYPCLKEMTITYTAGWTELPKGIKLDIMRLVAYLYENRGDDPKVQSFVFDLSVKWSRNLAIA